MRKKANEKQQPKYMLFLSPLFFLFFFADATLDSIIFKGDADIVRNDNIYCILKQCPIFNFYFKIITFEAILVSRNNVIASFPSTI